MTSFTTARADDAARRQFAAKTFTWLRQVAVDKALRPSDLKIAVALTRYFKEQDQGGRAYPSCLTIAHDAHLEESTVVCGVRRLQAQGHLTVVWGDPVTRTNIG